jgi:hypothetical protein
VSEQFWDQHPEWREKTALLQDAHLDWRKLVNLANPDCRREAARLLRGLIGRFDWDGVNLAELYFESLEGVANPARFTPMNADVRREFLEAQGFDPLELFRRGSPRHHTRDAAGLRAFLDYRARLARRLQAEWLAELEALRSAKPDLDLVLTHVDDGFDASIRDTIAADSRSVLPLMDQYNFTFLVEDPATVWHLGPQRYPEIARRYQTLTRHTARLGIDINVVERYQEVYPTKKQTGTELLQLIRSAARSFPRVALYFENSILAPDLPLLSSAAAVEPRRANWGEVGRRFAPRSRDSLDRAGTGGRPALAGAGQPHLVASGGATRGRERVCRQRRASARFQRRVKGRCLPAAWSRIRLPKRRPRPGRAGPETRAGRDRRRHPARTGHPPSRGRLHAAPAARTARGHGGDPPASRAASSSALTRLVVLATL